MKKEISLYKKIKIFREFRKTLKKNSDELKSLFNARLDKAYRIYSVINIPSEYIEEPYNLRKSDIDKIAESIIKEYSIGLSKYLDSKELNETYSFYEVQKVDKYSYLVVFGFSLFKSNIFYDRIRFRVIPAIILLLALSFIFFLS